MKTKLYHFLLLAFLVGISQNVSAQIGPVDFTAATTTGCGQLLTSFTATPANTNYTYHWDFGSPADGTETNFGINIVGYFSLYDSTHVCRTVTLTVTNNSGQSDSATKTICVYPNPNADFTLAPGTVTTGCAPLCVQVIDQSTLGVGASSIVSWQWSSGGGVPNSIGYPSSPTGYNATNITNPTFCFNSAGNYFVNLSVIDNNGCRNTVYKPAVSIPIAPKSVTTLPSASNCSAPFTLSLHTQTSTFGNPNPSVTSTIDYGDGLGFVPLNLNNGNGNHTHTYNTAGVFLLQINSSNSLGCFRIDTTIINLPIPVGATIQQIGGLCGNSELNAIPTGCNPPYTYTWSNGGTTQQINNIPSGTYTVTVVDALAQTSSASIYIQAPSFRTDTLRCTSQDLRFTNNYTGQNPVNYNWSFPGANTTSSTARIPININYSNEGYYTVCLTVTDNNPIACSTTVCQQVHIANPHISFTIDTSYICSSSSAQFISTSTNISHYQWVIIDALGNTDSGANIPDPAFYFTDPGLYTAKLIGETASGCLDSASLTFHVWTDTIYRNNRVYPGDANHDGIANNLDLLPIALNTSQTGPARTNPSLQWNTQNCGGLLWNRTIQNTSTDLKHVDCDGNGTIQAVDTLAILQNYGMVHQRQPLVTFANAPSISCVFPSDTTHNASYPYTLQSSVNVGDAANPATDITGLAFTINYDNTLADAAYINLDNFSWLGAPNELYHLQHDDGQGHLDVAISRFDGGMRNGFGRVATCNFVITDNVIGRGLTSMNYPFNVSISKIKAIDNLYNDKPMNGAATNTVFTNMILATSENNLAQRIRLYPNPLSANSLQFNMEGLNCERIAIFNTLGQLVFSQKTANKSQFSLELPELIGGVYWVEMNTNAGKAVKKLVVSR